MVHYSEDGKTARCGAALNPRFRGTDYTTTWSPETAVPVDCTDCLFLRPPLHKVPAYLAKKKKAKLW